ncbi:MAG TPA: hypothetical protein VFO29_01815 [Candidatus Rubrimentiphilum sp.]|nr:hypothetical protein [Candidatus Rubrimentiphilum sp.]
MRLRQHARKTGSIVSPINDGASRAERGADVFTQGFDDAFAVEDVAGAFVDERKQGIQLGFAVGGRRTTL